MKTIKFTHEYDKLKDEVFTTIRGKTYFLKCKTQEVVVVQTPSESFYAVIVELGFLQIKNISIDILKKDIAPYPIKTRWDFIRFLNKFRRFHKLKSTDDHITMIKLKKLEA